MRRAVISVGSLHSIYMDNTASNQELHHEIFGSILDRTEMTPFLLLPARDYATALSQAARMMGNRGFDILGNAELQESEKERANRYIGRVYSYFLDWLFPFVRKQLEGLAALQSANSGLYRHYLHAIWEIGAVLMDTEFRSIISEDPRHLFLLASSRRYPGVFHGYKGSDLEVPGRVAADRLLHAQDGPPYQVGGRGQPGHQRLRPVGLFLQAQGQSLDDLYRYGWDNPKHIPDNEPAQRAFVKVSTFFHKLKESMTFDQTKGCLVFNSGDGVSVDIIEVKARLKSPESMFTKLGKNVEAEAYDIRDILAITFILKSMDDTLKLFHALQKRGVILQEYTASHSITQTLFESPQSMREAVRRLMVSLAQSSGNDETPGKKISSPMPGRFTRPLV